ncbi:hypothetical protein KJ758_00525 [Patescibacteria group bacterium]|nr:hypothetical protein [Patescibacteria group bacterium]
MADTVRINKVKDRSKERKAIFLIVAVMVGVVVVWFYQTASLFSQDALSLYQDKAKVTNQQIDEGLELRNKLEEQMPLLDSDPLEVVNALQMALDQRRAEEAAVLDSIAQQVMDELEAASVEVETLPSAAINEDSEIIIE